MAATLTSTGVTFSDGTALASAAPTISQIGGLCMGYYTATTLSNSTNGRNNVAQYGVNTTIAGSSLAYNVAIPANSSGLIYTASYLTYSSRPWSSSTFYVFPQRSIAGTGGVAWSTSNANFNTFTTSSGSWRSVTPFNITQQYAGYDNTQTGYWDCAMWQRYA